MANVYNIGVVALNAANAGLITTGHNISNASTEGYRRQALMQSNATPQYTGYGFFGAGVQVDTVRRMYNQFLETQALSASSEQNSLDEYYANMRQIDNMLADREAGLAPAMDDFFSAVNDMAANPSSIPGRQSVLSTAESMTARFHAIDQRFDELRRGVNNGIVAMTTEINTHAQKISQLNEKIAVAESASMKHQANDLRDQRDQVVAELNTLLKATVIEQGSDFNIFVGNGQALVVGGLNYSLVAGTSPEDTNDIEISYQGQGSTVPLKPSLLTGGKLGGLLAFRDQSLNPSQNSLGRIAAGVSQAFNDQHRLGIDLAGQLGGNFFSQASSTGAIASTDFIYGRVVPNAQNTSPVSPVLTATLTDVGSLTTSDYTLTFNAVNDYSLVRKSDNTTIFANKPLPQSVEGFTLKEVTAPTAAGDTFLIQPTRTAGYGIGVNITDPTKMAVGAPMRTAASTNNVSSATIDEGIVNSYINKVTITFTGAATFDVVDSVTGATLAKNAPYVAGNNIDYNGWRVQVSGAPNVGDKFYVDDTLSSVDAANGGTGTISVAIPKPPATQYGPDPDIADSVTITFDNPPTTFTVTGSTTGFPTAAVTYTTGQPISFNGWTVKISGSPAAGDVFTVGPNSGGVDDNRNGILLSKLQTKGLLIKNSSGNPTATFMGTYSQLVSSVGNKTREIEITSKGQATLFNSIHEAQQEVSGVNLDEEAANLIRYQQAYQAAGKMIQVATTLFDTLLGLGR